jgi:hypothetical protein
MSPDFINGAFEFIGSVLTWMNVYRVWKDKGYAGIYAPAIIFFFSWGVWNLFYYPHLGQWWSFFGGCSIALANFVWVTLMFRYGRIKRESK